MQRDANSLATMFTFVCLSGIGRPRFMMSVVCAHPRVILVFLLLTTAKR